MKITVKEIVRKQEEIKLENLKPGTVISFNDRGPIGLVVMGMGNMERDLILLTHLNDDDDPDWEWFSVAGGWKKFPIKKILGKLIEIVVDPNV